MKEIKAGEIKQNIIDLIGNKKLLIGAGNESDFNMMTASWGFMGVMWNAPSVAVVVRPQRYTREFLEENELFSITVLEDMEEAYNVCGTKSGRDIDKCEATGLTPEFTQGTVTFKQAKLTLICRKQYVQRMEENCFTDKEPIKWYPNKDYHDLIIGKIEKVLLDE